MCRFVAARKAPLVGSSPRRTDPTDPPVEADDLLRQATDVAVSGDTSAADPDEEATTEAESEPSEDEIKVLREHFRRHGGT